MIKNALVLVVVAGLSVAASAAVKKPAKSAPASLSAGQYTAHVAMLACSACGANVEKVLNATKGIESAKVDSDKSSVTFTVKPGAKIKVADLQKTLKSSADEMGMGADYRLSKISELSAQKS